MRKTDAFRRAAALLAALSITVSLAAPAFADIYYIDDGDIIITKDENGRQTVKRGESDTNEIVDSGEIIITTREQTITTQESDLEGPAAEDSGFGPVVEDNYQPAQPEDAEEPKDDDQPESTEEPEDADQPEGADRKESTEEPKAADQQENAEESENTDRQEDTDQQAAPADAVPAAPAPANGFCKNIITVINKCADKVLNLTLKDVKIDVSDTGIPGTTIKGKAALSVQGQGNVEIELDGDNELKSGANRAGLEKNTSEGTLTLKDDKNEAGSLKATGGENGAGIGGGNRGSGKNITIKGGTVNATGGLDGAGIGGGLLGSGKNITINGGTVTADGGDYSAGIGGGNEGSGEDITINGGTVTAAGSWGAAGIGGGERGNGEDITITDGTVNAAGGYFAAGIGGGSGGSGSNVTVSGAAQVTAVAGKSKTNHYYPYNKIDSGATIGNGSRVTSDALVNGEEIQADISGLMTTGYIHHIIYNEDGSVKQEWREFGHLQPAPDTPNAPAEESNEVDLGIPWLYVETLEGSPLPFNARQQGSTLRVTTDNLSARLYGTRQTLEALREQGVEQIQFVTSFKTTTLPVEDLLAEGGSWFALEHNGLVSRRLSAAQAESLKCQMR